MANQARRPTSYQGTLGLFVLLLTVFCFNFYKRQLEFLEQKHSKTSLSPLFSKSHWKLESQQKYNEVRVPFSQRRGHIYVQAIWAGKSIKCLVDTGATYISWPQPLGLASIPTGIQTWSATSGGIRVYGEWVLAPSLQLGGFKLQNIPTILYTVAEQANGQKTFVAQAEGIKEIVLGNEAFHNVVLTIDYQKQEVILRDSDYDITHLPHPHSYLLNLSWNDGTPVVLGQLAGHPARFMLDTGSNDMVISSAFAQKYFSRYPRRKSRYRAGYGLINTDEISGANGSIGNIKFMTDSITIFPFSSTENVDGLIGEPFLKYFRITIDYRRSKILLEPNS